jgi:hypothetical protein
MSKGGEASLVMDFLEKLAAFDGGLTFTHAPFKFAKDCATSRRSECKDRSP